MFDNGRLLLRKARKGKLHVSLIIILYPWLNFSTIERHNWLKNYETLTELRIYRIIENLSWTNFLNN